MGLQDVLKQLFNGKNYMRSMLGLAWCIFAMTYIFYITTHKIEQSNQHIVDNVLGFLQGTAVGTIITYFFGSSQGSADKNELIKEAPKGTN